MSNNIISRLNRFFESGLETRVRMMSRRWDIHVVIRGSRAYTDGSTIYLPMLEDAREEVIADLDGFADHEVAHIKFSDFACLHETKNRFHSEFLNALEDSRIEILIIEEFPGCQLSLDRLNAKWGTKQDEARFKTVIDEKTGEERFKTPWPVRFICAAREVFDGKPPKLDEQIEVLLLPVVNDLVEARKCETSRELMEATREIINKVNAIRESLYNGMDWDMPDEDFADAMDFLQGGEPPIELDPNRKNKKSREAVGQETLDPAVEKQESEEKTKQQEGAEEKGDAESSDSDETEEGDGGESKDSDSKENSKDGKESSDDQDENADGDSDSDSDSDSDVESDSSDETDEGADATDSGKDDSDSNDTGNSKDEKESDSDGSTSGDEGDEEGDWSDDESDAESNSSKGKDNDALNAPDKDEPNGEGDTGIEPDELDEEGDKGIDDKKKVSDEKLDNMPDAPKSLEQSQTTDKKAGDETKEPKRISADALDRIKSNAKDFSNQETDSEKEMLDDEVGDASEFDEHVFSAESYMEMVVEEAVSREVSSGRKSTYFDDVDDSEIDERCVSLPYTREFDEVIDYDGKGDPKQYAERRKMIMPFITPIRLNFERVLKVIENARWHFEQERGQLDKRSLAKLITDRNFRRPFKKLTQQETKNVAVTLLTDCSGSMWGDPIELARQAMLAIGEALKAMNIPFEALGFNTGMSSEMSNATAHLSSEEKSRFNRLRTTLRLMVFKSFGCNDLSGICKAESGGANADGESLIWAAKRLAQRTEKRKILIVLSDGEPSAEGDGMLMAGDLKRVVKMLPKAGIEVIGIGIMTDSPKHFYPKWVEVNDIQMLPTTVMNQVAKIITDGLKGR